MPAPTISITIRATGELSYDANGSAAGGNPLVFAVLGTTTHPVLVAGDFQIIG